MQRGRIFLGSTCVCPSSETWRKRDHTEGDEGREVSGALLFMVSDLFQGLSVRRRCERASEADNERDVFSFFEREGQPKDPEGLRLPIRTRAQFTTRHRINRKFHLNP